MSLHLEFEPNGWYMGFAIRKEEENVPNGEYYKTINHWHAYIANGMTGYVDSIEDKPKLDDLKAAIREYHLTAHNSYGEQIAKRRLSQLRLELITEGLSYGEIVELQNLVSYINDDDVELLEAAGVPESQR